MTFSSRRKRPTTRRAASRLRTAIRTVLGIALGLGTAASASAQYFTATPVITSGPTPPPAYLPQPIASTSATMPAGMPGPLPINELNPTTLPTAPSSKYQTAIYTRAPMDEEGGVIGPPSQAPGPIVRTVAQVQNRNSIYDEDADFTASTRRPGPAPTGSCSLNTSPCRA
jgi:hypothetical protein